MTPVVVTDHGVTLVGGGTLGTGDLDQALALAPVLVAADGGADAVVAAGHLPQAVIGDFDSLSDATRRAIPGDRLHEVAEQDSRDFEKCLGRIAARFVLAVGFTGGRVDHTLAGMSAMVQHDRPPVLMLGRTDVILRAPRRIELPLARGTRVSLFPMGPSRGRSIGLRWPIDGLEFAPDRLIGTSNEATGPVTIEMEGPMLLILPRDCLEIALAGVGSAPV